MRNKKFFAFLAALAVLIASPAVLFGADANSDIKTYVNGKELDEIDDILKEANGGKTSLPKHSLMILQISSPGKNNQTDTGKLSYRFLPFNADGTAMTNYDNFNTPFGNETEFNNYNVGVHSPVASYLSGKGRGRYVFIHDKPAIGKATFNAQLYLIEKENGVGENDKAPTVTKIGSTINKNLGEYSNSISKYCYIMDAKSGLVVDPDNPDEEFFAVSTLCDAQMGNVSGNSYPVICFFKISEDEDGKAAFSEELLTIKETANSPYTPAQIAVGDFMGTGMNNQVALVFSNSDSVVLKIYTIKKNAAGALIYESTRTDTVYKYKTAIGNFDGLYSFPVADIAAGDFDGDGKKELAITYKPVTYRPETNVSDADGEKIAMKIYKWQNGAFKTEETTTKCYYYSGGGKVVQSGVTWFKPVAADLDGDGKDELAVVVSIWGYTHSKGILFAKDTYRVKSDLHMTFWSCAAGSIKPVFKGPQIFANGSNSELNRFTYFYPTGQTETNVGAEMGYPFPYMPRSISVVAGPFRGAVGKYRTKDDVIVSFQDTYLGYGNNDAKRDNNIMLFWPKNNNFNGWNYKKFSSGKNNLNGLGIGLVASDFMHEGAELGDVRHLVVSDRKTCAAIIQAQPYHFDVIPLPWENDTTPVATNFNYEPKARTIYSRSGESSTNKDTTFESSTSLEGISQLGLMVKSKTIKKIKEAVKVAGFYVPGIATTAAAAKKLVGKYVADDILKGLLDTSETTTTTIKSAGKSVSWKNKIEAGLRDSQLFYNTRVHVWRYPIKAPAPKWLVGNLENGSELAASGDLYMTVIAPDQPSTSSNKSIKQTVQGMNESSPLYQPSYEEGNLFSYPTLLSAIPGYAQRQTGLITKPEDIYYSPNRETYKATVKVTSGDATTTSKEMKYGTISKTIGTVKSLFGASDDLTPPAKPETFTRKFGNSETLEVRYPDPVKPFDYRSVTFGSRFDMYVDEGGIMTVGYAVTDLPNTASLWGPASVYWKSPDPALLLPDKFAFAGATGELLVRNERDAMKMRGVRIINKTAGYTFSNSIVYPGLSFDIEVPVYNASFLPSDDTWLDVPITLSYRKSGNNGSGTEIGRTTVKLGGWKAGTERNKATAVFEWEVPEDLERGLYEFYVVIDPDDTIKNEVHEAWSPKIPGGNNTGYSPFGVSHGEEFAKTKMTSADYGIKFKSLNGKNVKPKTAAVKTADDDDWWPDSDYESWNDDIDLTDIVSGDTEFIFEITYQDDDILDEAWVEVLIDMKDEDGEDYSICLMSEMLPVLAKGDIIPISFMLSDEEIKNGKNLRMIIADDEEYVEISLDDSDESNKNGIINKVISKVFTRYKTAPVLWRIGNITFSPSSSSLNTADDDNVIDVTVVPENAETVPTDKITVTVSTIAGKTLEGVYNISLQTSTDGVTWTDEEPIKFDTQEAAAESELKLNSSSGSGCDVGLIGAVGLLGLFALLKNRARSSR